MVVFQSATPPPWPPPHLLHVYIHPHTSRDTGGWRGCQRSVCDIWDTQNARQFKYKSPRRLRSHHALYIWALRGKSLAEGGPITFSEPKASAFRYTAMALPNRPTLPSATALGLQRASKDGVPIPVPPVATGVHNEVSSIYALLC